MPLLRNDSDPSAYLTLGHVTGVSVQYETAAVVPGQTAMRTGKVLIVAHMTSADRCVLGTYDDAQAEKMLLAWAKLIVKSIDDPTAANIIDSPARP